MGDYGREEGTYARDADRLFKEYTNLRMSLFNKYQNNFRNQETKNELMSYIDEQFVKLVKEYDINSPVDFPGYVKTKLTARVAYSFVGGKHRDNSREVIMKEEGTLQQLIENEDTISYQRLEMEELIKHLFKDEGMSEASWDIMEGWMQYKTERDITVEVATKYDDTYASVEREKERIKKIVEKNLETYG